MQSRIPRKIGLFGGSFDPVHNGHLQIANIAKQAMQLDFILFIPNYCSPFKTESPPASIAHRISMLEIALTPYPNFLVSLVETSPEVHYTGDTIKIYLQCYPSDHLFFLGGQDILESLSQWKNFSTWISKISFIIVSRSKHPSLPSHLITYREHFSFLQTKSIDISSSEIREQILLSPQEEIASVPKKVSDYIKGVKLYQR